MCLAIPMQIIEINGYLAQCEAQGVRREVSLFMLQDETLKINDYVMVHVGYAIQKVAPEQARSSWELFDAMLKEAVNNDA